jgi:hypothetical protein
MLALNYEFDIEKQIDRACSAQSAEMLPKVPPSLEEVEAKRTAMDARIKSQFNGLL